MPKPEKAPGRDDSEGEVWNAIAIFEQILEAMPDDRASLEALSHAYEQVGDHARAKQYLIRLAQVLVAERQVEAAQALVAKLRAYAADDPQAKTVIEHIEQLAASAERPGEAPPGAARPEEPSAAAARAASNIAEEMALAWQLLQAHRVSQEEYASIVQDLTEMSASANAGTVTVLHALQARGFRNLEQVIAEISKECNTPIISLSSFDLRADIASALPLAFSVRRGALVFERIGKDALVAILNPYDKQLRKDIEALTGAKCHYFLTLPNEFDAAIEKIRSRQADEQAAQKKT